MTIPIQRGLDPVAQNAPRRAMRSAILVALLLLLAVACSAQTWATLPSIPGTAYDYQAGMSFELNGKIYVGGGYYSKAFYMYDPITLTWTAKADLPGCTYGRYQGIAFSLNGHGYIAFGEDIDPWTFDYTKLTDMWMYDDVTDAWSLAPAFPGQFRFAASVFVVNDKAYLIGGADINNVATNQTWEFDGTIWTQKANYPQSNIAGTATFVLNGMGYSVGGFKATMTFGVYLANTYQYDPVANTWTAKAAFPGAGRADFFGFNTLTRGYCGLGSSLNTVNFTFDYYNDFYAYDDATNTWGPAITSFPGPVRQQGFFASLGSTGFIGGGYSYIGTTETFYTDWYRFNEATIGIDEIDMPSISLYPVPCSDILHIARSSNAPQQARITDAVGNLVLSENVTTSVINVSGLPNGVYALRLGNGVARKFIKQ